MLKKCCSEQSDKTGFDEVATSPRPTTAQLNLRCFAADADHAEEVPPLVCEQGGLTSVSTVLPRRTRRVLDADHAEVVPPIVCEQGGLTSVSTALPRRARWVARCGHFCRRGIQGYNTKARPYKLLNSTFAGLWLNQMHIALWERNGDLRCFEGAEDG